MNNRRRPSVSDRRLGVLHVTIGKGEGFDSERKRIIERLSDEERIIMGLRPRRPITDRRSK